jgi:hypothetical protein
MLPLQLVNPPMSLLKKLFFVALSFFVLFKLGLRVRVTFE